MTIATQDPAGARERLASLRHRVAAIEDRPRPMLAADGDLSPATASRSTAAGRHAGLLLPFGIDAVDQVLKGGLAGGALHEIHAAETRHSGLATGFLAALLARLTHQKNGLVIWAHDRPGPPEAGHLYGPGIARFGFDPAHLLMIAGQRADDVLWAMEEGLSCRGVAAVVGDLSGQPRALDLTAARRLALRAQAGGGFAMLLRRGDAIIPTAAQTRWQVQPHEAGIMDDFETGIGRPAWRLELQKNRAGPTGQWIVEWNHDTCRFALAAAHSFPVATPADDRPHRPAHVGTVMAV